MDTILVVDDEVNYLTVMEALLGGSGYEVPHCPQRPGGPEDRRRRRPGLVLTDMKMPKMTGIELLEELHRLYPELPVIIMTAYGTVEKAVTAMKKGAFDYILKPFKNDEILVTIAKALEHRHLLLTNRLLYQELEKKYGFPNIVGESKGMQEILALVKRVATSKATVLVSGESGTGKELIARALHQNSNRAQKPFISVNCAASLKPCWRASSSATNGAPSPMPWPCARAALNWPTAAPLPGRSGGDVPGPQVKLLRVLQEMEFERVGGNRTIKVDVRVVAATNRDLKEDVEAGRFREDLFYRLNVVHLHVPALRQREDDIRCWRLTSSRSMPRKTSGARPASPRRP